MNNEEAEAIIHGCLRAVNEQYVLPLTLAIETLILAACHDRAAAEAIASALRLRADSCPPDVAGRHLLEGLAMIAASCGPDVSVRSSGARISLQLVQSDIPPQDD